MIWKTVKINDVCLVTDYVANGSFKSLSDNVEYLTNDGYAILVRLTDFTKGWNGNYKYVDEHAYNFLAKTKLFAGDLLISNVGEPGKTFLVPELDMPMTLGPNSILVRPNNNVLNTKFFKYLIDSLYGKSLLDKITSGTTQKKFNKTGFRNLEIPLPPLAEQERIVAKLDAAFAEIGEAISTAESKESEVQALKTSILSKLLNNKSNGWESSYLEGVSSFISRGISPKYIESGGVRVLNQKCIRNHRINYDLARRHDIDLKKVSEERFIRLGDILINSTGQGTLGRVAQVRKEPNELTTIDSHITIVRPKSELFYLDYFGYAAIAIEKIIQDAGQGTSGQTELAKSKVQNDFQICFPRSFSDQEAEVKKLDIVFEEIEIALKNLTKSKTNLYALKSAILSQELQSSEAA